MSTEENLIVITLLETDLITVCDAEHSNYDYQMPVDDILKAASNFVAAAMLMMNDEQYMQESKGYIMSEAQQTSIADDLWRFLTRDKNSIVIKSKVSNVADGDCDISFKFQKAVKSKIKT